jgi:hypothetical protein
MKYILLIFIFTMSACGLKITEEVDENVLLGTWELATIICYESEENLLEMERYVIPSSLAIHIEFNGSKVRYSASGASCATSSIGLYSTNFNGTSTGVLDITDVVTGGETCYETITDSGLGTVGDVNVTTNLDGHYSKNLNWLITNERDILDLTYYSNFRGSANSLTCEEECYCKSVFRKDVN